MRARRQVAVASELGEKGPFGVDRTTAGRVLDRDQLINNALGNGVAVTNRTIDVHIAALRKKLGPSAGWIQTVRGVGYTFREPREESSRG